ncbi:MAG: mechanosensitive ion channel domain-containing protein [Pseudomonadota bacterium]
MSALSRHFLVALLGLCVIAALPGTAPGQGLAGVIADDAAPLPEINTESPEAVREMVSTLTDEQVRAILLERLDAVAEANATASEDGLGTVLQNAAESFVSSISGAVTRAVNIPAGVAQGLGRFYEPRGLTGTLHLIAILVLSLAVGYAAQWLVWRLTPEAVPPPAEANGRAPLGAALDFLLRRFVFEGLGLAAFIGAAWAVMALAHPPERISYLILTFFLFGPVLFTRLAVAIGRFVVAPSQPQSRLMRLDDGSARFLFYAMAIFAGLVGLRMYTLSFFGGHGVDLAAMRLGFWLSLMVYGWLIYVSWRARAALSGMLLSDEMPSPLERRVASAYPIFTMLLIAGFWVLAEIFVAQGLWRLLDGRLPLTLAILLSAPIVDVAVRNLAAYAAPNPVELQREPRRTLALRTRRGLVRMGRVGVFLGLMLILADIWNVSVTETAMGPLPARAALGLVEALGIVAVGYFVLEATTLWFLRRIVDETPEAPAEDLDAGGEGGGAGGSRLSTVLPLMMRAVQLIIIVITVFEGLSALGISIAPLLAGLGILGLAIGFGAQKLVADIVSGVFFLIDDAFRVGEYVEIEGTFGTVERISVRSLILRHHLGKVHTIPFGEIPKLTNYSRDWVIMKLRFTVPFDTDLMKVKKLFKKIGQEMMADPAFAEDFLQPFKSQGVLEVDDVGIVIRGKFMARPGRQWVLRKEIYQRVQRVFEQNGIEFARREVRVKIDGKDVDDDTIRRQAAAAAAELSTGQATGDAPDMRDDHAHDGPGA